MISYEQARESVVARVRGILHELAVETLALTQTLGRVLARDILSDRDYPPFRRSIRDGYAVRAVDTVDGASLQVIGELKAGDAPSLRVAPGTCVQIMTGAALPEGADAVVMIEHTERHGDTVKLSRTVKTGQHVVRRGSELGAGQIILAAGTRLGFPELAAAAQVGASPIAVVRRPRVAILTTGDEVVDFASAPGPFQIRNSNAVSLAAQVSLLHAEPMLLGNARDIEEDLRAKITAGLQCDALLLSGGVSAGKYDLVEPVLREFGAEIIFDAVAIRPGKPVVFAICNGKPVFGLPGNPVSTMVTFDLFVRPALELLSGAEPQPLPFGEAVLTETVTEKPGLTHFVPAKLAWPNNTPRVTPVPWQGSGDIVAMTRANCLLVVPPERETIESGERVHVLPRGPW